MNVSPSAVILTNVRIQMRDAALLVSALRQWMLDHVQHAELAGGQA